MEPNNAKEVDHPVTINTVLNLQIRYIPADTKVAEWIRAEAGTGASIESGSHKWPTNCTDFILAQIAKHNNPAFKTTSEPRPSHKTKYINASQSVVWAQW